MWRISRPLLVAIPGAGKSGAGRVHGRRGQFEMRQNKGGLSSVKTELRQRKLKGRGRAHLRTVIDRTEAAKEFNTVDNLRSMDPRDLKITLMTDALFSKGVRYLGCATNITFVPDGNPAVPEVMFCGCENVGKTSLIKGLVKRDREVAKSNTDHTRQAMNWFGVGNNSFNICDTPGYGGAVVPWSTVLQHAVLIRNFVRCRPSLKMVYYCISVSNNPGWYSSSEMLDREGNGMKAHPGSDGIKHRDLDMLKFLKAEVPNHTIVLTKAEGVNVKVSNILSEMKLHGIIHPMIVTSSKSMMGLEELRFDVVSNVLHSIPTENLTLRAAHQLGNRILTKSQIATFRPVMHVGSSVDEELDQWKIQEKKLEMLESAEETVGQGLLEPERRKLLAPTAAEDQLILSLEQREEAQQQEKKLELAPLGDGRNYNAEDDSELEEKNESPLNSIDDYLLDARRGGAQNNDMEDEDPDLITGLFEEEAAATGEMMMMGGENRAELLDDRELDPEAGVLDIQEEDSSVGADLDDTEVESVLAALAAGRQGAAVSSHQGAAQQSLESETTQQLSFAVGLLQRPTQAPLPIFDSGRLNKQTTDVISLECSKATELAADAPSDFVQRARRAAALQQSLQNAEAKIRSNASKELAALEAVDKTHLTPSQRAYVEVQKDDLAAKTERSVRLYKSSYKTLTNQKFMSEISQTSPWRNPLLYPTSVVPTASPRVNLMKCPEDPYNPYLFQSQCVAPRMDMNFRKPSDRRKYQSAHLRRGSYQADRPMSYFQRPTTIPCFPDLVDLSSFPNPQPHQFFFNHKSFFETSAYKNKLMGLRYVRQVTHGAVNALAPTENLPKALAAQVRKLEEERYGQSNTLLGAATSRPTSSLTRTATDALQTTSTSATLQLPKKSSSSLALNEYDALLLKAKRDQAAHQPVNPSFGIPDRFRSRPQKEEGAPVGGEFGTNMAGAGRMPAAPIPQHTQKRKPMLVPTEEGTAKTNGGGRRGGVGSLPTQREANPHPSTLALAQW